METASKELQILLSRRTGRDGVAGVEHRCSKCGGPGRDLAGNVWVINNWQDIDSNTGPLHEVLSIRCGGQGVVIFYGMA